MEKLLCEWFERANTNFSSLKIIPIIIYSKACV